MEYMSKEKFEEAEKIEKFRNKMLKYIVYKNVAVIGSQRH